MTSFNPNVNGTVNSIALNPTCTTAYLGGKFTTVGGQSATNIAAVNAQTGALVSTFKHSASGQVEALLYTHNELLTGGYFKSINGATRTYLASLNPASGAADNYLNVPISGNYPPFTNNGTRVYNFNLSHLGDRALVTGDFTSVAGQNHQQVFQINLGTTSATVNTWTSPDFNIHCADSEPFYIQDAAYSPDDKTVYTVSTGYKSGSGLHTGVCDAVAAYTSSGTAVHSSWVNFTGCDSLFSVAADASSVYVGGHQRWLNNSNACDSAGAGSVPRPGIGAVSPSTGLATAWNPTRSRGSGADDLVLTSAGLWVASDTNYGATQCGNERHPGICFLPY
jgi:hypothetical protein